MVPLLDALRAGRALLMDGAMGTELQRVGLKSGENAAAWVIFHPEKIRAVHHSYLQAGAQVLLTNTFLINAQSFDEAMRGSGRPGQHGDRWREALDLIGPTALFRLAAVGPVAGAPSEREFNDLRHFFVPDACSRDGPHESDRATDAILLETCSSPRVRFVLRNLRKYHARPLFLSLTYLRNHVGELVTSSGHSPEWFGIRAKSYGASALGVNCGRDVGMDEVIEIIRRYRQVTDLPLFARPNAGTPRRARSGWIFPHTPKAMAARLPELLEAGASMVGGCCGTTPEHIAAYRPIVEAWNIRRGLKGSPHE